MALLAFRRIQIEMVGTSAAAEGPCEIGYANIQFLPMFVIVVSVPAIYNTHHLFCFFALHYLTCVLFHAICSNFLKYS
jgi:hypothetical protein